MFPTISPTLTLRVKTEESAVILLGIAVWRYSGLGVYMQDFHSLVADFEIRLIQNALDQNDGKQTHEAAFLGITYREFRYLVDKYSDRLTVFSRRGNPAREKRLIAYVTYNEALKSGALVKPDSCSVCGWVGAIQGHHPDYDKPLEVVWVCGPCHRLEHSRLKQLSRKQTIHVVSVVT